MYNLNFVSVFPNKAIMMKIVMITIFFVLHIGSQKRKCKERRGELKYSMVEQHFRALMTSRGHQDMISTIKDTLTKK